MKLPGTPESRRFAAMVGVFVAAGVAVTWLLLPPSPIDPQKEAVPVIHVAGVPLPAEGDAVANALDLVRRYAAGEMAIVLPDKTERKVKRGALGAEIDRVRLAEFVREARRPGSAIWRAHKDKNPNGPIEVPLPVSIDADAAVQKLLDLKGQLDAPAVDAFVDLQERKLRPEKLGHRLDVYGTLARLDAALRLGQDKVEAVVETVQPRLLASALGNVRFDQVLGYFETRYSQGGKYKERTYNLRLAASKLDGAVVMPGEVFDFNGVVGPRDEANGYRVAPVIAQGELVDGLGGGTCQISGTLHGAAFFAGMEITERYPHSRPSYYIKLGLDATVVYPTINFRFKNPFDYPVVLHQTVQNGVVRAEILGPSRKLTVTYFRRIDEVVPFEQLERQSDKLPEGTRRLAQRGIPGFKTTSSRVVRDGAYAVRQKWKDTYPPTMEIITVGTGAKELEVVVADDAHPEYVVDEYLVVTQGPDIRTPGAGGPEPGGGTIETREPGRTGEYGWYEKAGLAAYKTEAGDASTKVNDVAPAEGEASGVKATSRAEERDKDAAEEARGEARARKGDKGDEGEQPKKKKKKRKKPKAEE